MKKGSQFREEVSSNLQEILQDKNSKAIKYDKLLSLYKKLNGVLTIFDQWEKDLLNKERSLASSRSDNASQSQGMDSLNGFISKMENIEQISKKTFEDILAQKNELKEHEKALENQQAALNSRRNELLSWEQRLKQAERGLAGKPGIQMPTTNSELSKAEQDRIEKLKLELDAKNMELAKREMTLDRRQQDLAAKELDLQDKENQLNHRERTFNTKDAFLSNREERLQDQEQENQDRATDLVQKQKLIDEREARLVEREQAFGEREQNVVFREQTQRDKENQLMKKEQDLLEKEMQLANTKADLEQLQKSQEDQYSQKKKNLDLKEQTLLKLKDTITQEKLEAHKLYQSQLEELSSKGQELTKREKDCERLRQGLEKKQKDPNTASETNNKKGLDPGMLEAYRRETEKAFAYTKSDIKRALQDYTKKGRLESPNNSFSQEQGQGDDKERQKLAFGWFKNQLTDKIMTFEQFLTGRMVELQSYLDPDSIVKSEVNREQFKLELAQRHTDDRDEIEDLKHSLNEYHKDHDQREEYYKKRENDLLHKTWRIKTMVRKLNLNIKENTMKNLQEVESHQSMEAETGSHTTGQDTRRSDEVSISKRQSRPSQDQLQNQGDFSQSSLLGKDST